MRRIELITGLGRRRQWSQNDKARLVIESLKPGANVSEVARRNGLSPQHLFGWRRQARALMAEEVEASRAPVSEARSCSPRKPKVAALTPADPAPAFASVVIAASPSPPSPPAPLATRPATTGRIEIAIGDTVVRVVGLVEAAHLTTVLRAVRRAS